MYQMSYSRDAIKALIASPSDREAAARQIAEAAGHVIGKLNMPLERRHHLWLRLAQSEPNRTNHRLAQELPEDLRPELDGPALSGEGLPDVSTVAVGPGYLETLGVPLVLPIAVLTFLGAYIPIVGAFVVGLLLIPLGLWLEHRRRARSQRQQQDRTPARGRCASSVDRWSSSPRR